MKSQNPILTKAALLLLALLSASVSHAVTQTKANNSDDLDLGSSWVSGTAPGAGDSAVWSGTSGFNSTASLGADMSWDTITVSSASGGATGTVTINGNNTLTLTGTLASHVAINADSSANADLTLNCNLTTGTSAAQSWNIGSFGGVHILTIAGTATATNTALTLGSGNGDTNITGSLITTKQIIKKGSGTLRLSGSNSITGGISIATGYVLLTASNALQSTISTTGAATTVTQIQLGGGNIFGFNASFGSTHVNTRGTGDQLVNVSGSNTMSNIAWTQGITGTMGIRSDAGSLSINQIVGNGEASTKTYKVLDIGGAGDITVVNSFSDSNGNGSQYFSVNKYGTGTLRLKGGSILYGGTTTVEAGTLIISGSMFGSPVAVNSGATLGGAGFAAKVNVQGGGIVAPGNNDTSTIGILKTKDFTLAGTLSSELGKAVARSGSSALAGTDYDQVSVTGAADVTGADLKLTLNTGVETNDLYFLIINDGADAVSGEFATLNGIAASLTQGSTFSWGGQQFTISYTADSATNAFSGAGNDIALLAVPEPSTWAMVLGGFGLFNLLKRGQRRVPRNG